MRLIPGQILTPQETCELMKTPHRVLQIDNAADCVWCISLPRFREDGRVMGYVTGPVSWPTETIITALETGQLVQANFRAPTYWSVPDAEFVAEDLPAAVRSRRKKLQTRRDTAWTAIKPIIDACSLSDLIRGTPLGSLVSMRAQEVHRSSVTIYRLLHLYLAHGSVLNGLYPMTHRCGAPGKDRQPRKAMGRPSRRLQRGGDAKGSFVMASLDKARCGVAYAMVSKSCRVSVAYARMNAAHYSNSEIDEQGAFRATLFEQGDRPSRTQFCYWGKKLARSPEFGERNGLPTIVMKRTHRGGSTRELAQAVGECAQFDGTSTDVYLKSLLDRRKTLPPPTRSPIIEQRSTVLLAPFVGWHHPSSSTSLQAVYLGAIDKAELCERFGIRIPRGFWPGMLCAKYIVDNGEARTQEILDFVAQFRVDIEFAPSYAGAAKGDVETRHHADHKELDHRLAGTTFGHRRERGQRHPGDAALWNYYEYMQEYLRTCIESLEHEDPTRAPTQLIAKGLRPSRINILKWYMDNGQRADISFDQDQLRAMTLPTFDAVIQYNGIVLKYEDSNRRIRELRFFSERLRSDPRYQKAAATRRVVKVRVKFDPQNLSELWLPSTKEVIRCRNKSADDFLILHGTLSDLTQHREAESDYRAEHQQERDQAEAKKTLRRDATRAAASAEMKTQQGTHPVKVPKSKRNADLRNNAAAEQHLIEESSLTPTGVVSAARPLVVAPADTPHKRDVGGANSAAARAVAALVRGLPNAKQVP